MPQTTPTCERVGDYRTPGNLPLAEDEGGGEPAKDFGVLWNNGSAAKMPDNPTETTIWNFEESVSQAKAIAVSQRMEIAERTQRLREMRLAREAAGLDPIGKWEGPVRVARRFTKI